MEKLNSLIERYNEQQAKIQTIMEDSNNSTFVKKLVGITLNDNIWLLQQLESLRPELKSEVEVLKIEYCDLRLSLDRNASEYLDILYIENSEVRLQQIYDNAKCRKAMNERLRNIIKQLRDLEA